MIVVIGADGFLGRNVVAKLGEMPWKGKEVLPFHDSASFFEFLPSHYQEVDWVIYADKRERDLQFNTFRMEYVQQLWTVSAAYSVPLVYAFYQLSGRGETSFRPDYFAEWSGKQYRKPPYWYIFRLGEVYGPFEGAVGEESSHIFRWYKEIMDTGWATLCGSVPDVGASELTHDWIYSKDVVRVLYWFMYHLPSSGVYDLGSGFVRTDMAAVHVIFRTLKLEPHLIYQSKNGGNPFSNNFVFHPDLSKLRCVGYKKPFFSIEKGVKSYIQRHLQRGVCYE